ncbi:uncharacterized protein LOC100373344 [Saccoglossus kowalevskii]|uniref:Low-density lipoprotein receptor class A domain-containing protein 2-like n=1 Tax=Saccoglossus kowalevskii TaxID=10224 RepID=A0ABM0H1S5_SACKO|nr:PREDICTED: low-density lipoprotein receptor class A domain-containing protein 2-like [Saccoglossus kowalevskii]
MKTPISTLFLGCYVLLVISVHSTDAITTQLIMNENCNRLTVKKDAYRLESHVVDGTALSGFLDCSVTMQAMKNDQMLLISFLRENYYAVTDPGNEIESGLGNSTNCDASFLQIYDGRFATNDSLLLHTCGTIQPATFQTTTNFATVRMKLRDTSSVNFTILMTSFDFGSCTDEVTELKCTNGRCIPRTLRCDSANNCGDNSDQLVELAPSYCPYVRVWTYDDVWWWWIPLAVPILLYASYWCCWRPGYFPWRMACCRNALRDSCRDCCKHCCIDCSIGKGGKWGKPRKGREREGCTFCACCRSNDDAYRVMETGNGGMSGSQARGRRGDRKRSQLKKGSRISNNVFLVDEDGHALRNGELNGGVGDYHEFYNADGQHARECR